MYLYDISLPSIPKYNTPVDIMKTGTHQSSNEIQDVRT